MELVFLKNIFEVSCIVMLNLFHHLSLQRTVEIPNQVRNDDNQKAG